MAPMTHVAPSDAAIARIDGNSCIPVDARMVGFAPQRAANRDSSQTVGARGKCSAAEGAHSVWSKYGCVVGINRAHPQMC
ncbi:hypothetical protein OH687_21200 [Burkholderia anthina]|nr:hypothetical protein OH687_21200 [Burkholderia anthina]